MPKSKIVGDLAAQRADDLAALEMARSGMLIAEISARQGCDPSTAWRRVQRALTRHEAPVVAEYREIQNQRLEVAVNAIWPRILSGDDKAIGRLIQLSERQARLLGLDVQPGLVLEVTTVTDPEERRRQVAALRDELAERRANAAG